MVAGSGGVFPNLGEVLFGSSIASVVEQKGGITLEGCGWVRRCMIWRALEPRVGSEFQAGLHQGGPGSISSGAGGTAAQPS